MGWNYALTLKYGGGVRAQDLISTVHFQMAVCGLRGNSNSIQEISCPPTGWTLRFLLTAGQFLSMIQCFTE